MRKFRLKDCVEGWIIGDFFPSVVKTKDFEIAIKEFGADDAIPTHIHDQVSELTVVLDGQCVMNKEILNPGDGVMLNPGEISCFKTPIGCRVLVVKFPSIPHDKRLV